VLPRELISCSITKEKPKEAKRNKDTMSSNMVFPSAWQIDRKPLGYFGLIADELKVHTLQETPKFSWAKNPRK
jgi:hypothetical protein